MGFIGGGAILRKDNIVVGVTTAVTLWFVTVVGLCFGGGQIVLGTIATVLGLVTLWGLKQAERHVHQEHSASMLLETGEGGPNEEEIRTALAANKFEIKQIRISTAGDRTEYFFELQQLRAPDDTRTRRSRNR
jgi:putative Mg2+ transporter-C (MgtC) family protein